MEVREQGCLSGIKCLLIALLGRRPAGPPGSTSSQAHRMTSAPATWNRVRVGIGRRRRTLPVLIALLLALSVPVAAASQSLKGSRASVDRQARVAGEHDFSYLTTGARVLAFADRGLLVRVRSGADLELHGVSYPYARPEAALFVGRLSSQYRSACGERLVITSLTRPTTRQPRNASERSVHPTGMALDIRYSRSASCRRWLEALLLDLEKQGVLEATRERFPPHYHVAVFPRQYKAYVDGLGGAPTTRVASAQPTRAASPQPSVTPYKVRRGDSLWTIARAHGTTVADLRSRNNLANSRIFAGQVLEVPHGR
ncbi:MAG: LysM peptidoglycan-binding domain-containing protein [Gemmatimonadetes bacterium]|nr:LysM peptidoglycan-binding domain-containing protein [Gemmatimonadota bacterium]